MQTTRALLIPIICIIVLACCSRLKAQVYNQFIAVPQPANADNFAPSYLKAQSSIAKLDNKINTGQGNADDFRRKAKIISNLLDKFNSVSVSSNNYNAVYGQAMDSLKQVAIVNAAKALALDESNKGKTMSLKQLGYIYARDGDTLYSARIAKALDTIGYKFPSLAHGMLFGLETGTHFGIGASYAFGLLKPANRAVNELPKFGGIALGYELNPFAQYGGFKIAAFFGVNRIGFAFHYIYFGTNSYIDRTTKLESTLVAAHCLRPEIGLNLGYGQIMFGYNIIGADQRLADKNTLRNVRSNFNTWNIGYRFAIFQAVGANNTGIKKAMIEQGLKRKF